MTSKSPTIVFFGNERLATGVTTSAPTLRALVGAGYNVAAVVVNNENTTSRRGRDLEIQAVAELHNIPVHAPKNPVEIIDILTSLHADIGVLAAYGRIVPQRLIDVFRHGIINIHPSKLPLHRGSIPIESVILDGSETTGVSVMQLVSKMDAGPILAYADVELTGNETKQELADSLLEIGSQLVLHILPEIFTGNAAAIPQDDSQATYDKLIQKNDGFIDTHKSAPRLEREVRAFAGWPKSRTKLGGVDVVITKAHVVNITGEPGSVTVTEDKLLLHTQNSSLAIDELIPAGKKSMPVQAFLAGYKSRLQA